MEREQLDTMSIDELWALHTELDQVLAARLTAKKREFEKHLEQLGERAAWDEPGRNSAAKH